MTTDSTPKVVIANAGTALQAVETEYKGPTNHRGSRVLVRAQCGRTMVPWDHSLNIEDNHAAAARVFIQAHGWDDRPGVWVAGARADGRGYVFAYVRGKVGE